VLLHGFPFDSRIWHRTPVVEELIAAGRSVVLMDRRGSGRSDRPHDPRLYADNACARDVSYLVDHLGLEHVDLACYSLGSWIGLRVLQSDHRVKRAVLGGMGTSGLNASDEMRQRFLQYLKTDDPDHSSDFGRNLRVQIERLGADRDALIAMWTVPFVTYDDDFARIDAEVLIIAGERDAGTGDPHVLAALLPNAAVFRPPTDHASTLGHPSFAKAVANHLNPAIGERCRRSERHPDASNVV
jgi:pimeloyl-ACP methyl ester carboxylesterase